MVWSFDCGQAQAQAQPGAAASHRVLITVAAPSSETEQLEAVFRELLQRLEMEVELRRVEAIDVGEIRRRPPAGQSYFARVWIAFARSGRARVYLEHSERDRVLVRDVAADSSNPELVREELGHIVQAAIEGLKAGEEIGAPRDQALLQAEPDEAPPQVAALPTAPAAAPEPEPGPRRRKAYRFGPRYEAVWLGDASLFEDGPGAVFGWVSAARVGVELSAYYRRPLKIEASPVGARMQTLALRALLSFDAWSEDGSLLRLAAGAGADLVRVSPLASPGSDIELAPSGWLQLALGRVTLSYVHELASFVDFELSLGADLDPAGTHYVFRRSAGEAAVLAPWPVRPLLSLGATVP